MLVVIKQGAELERGLHYWSVLSWSCPSKGLPAPYRSALEAGFGGNSQKGMRLDPLDKVKRTHGLAGFEAIQCGLSSSCESWRWREPILLVLLALLLPAPIPLVTPQPQACHGAALQPSMAPSSME